MPPAALCLPLPSLLCWLGKGARHVYYLFVSLAFVKETEIEEDVGLSINQGGAMKGEHLQNGHYHFSEIRIIKIEFGVAACEDRVEKRFTVY